jgi:hypothetical protein
MLSTFDEGYARAEGLPVRLIGLGLVASDWTFTDRTLRDARAGDWVTVTDDAGREERLIVSERDEGTGTVKLVDPDAPETNGFTLDGTPDASDTVSDGNFVEVTLPGDVADHYSIAGDHPATVTPYVITEDVTLSDRVANTTISVSNADSYTPGLVVGMGDCLWTIDGDGVDGEAGTLTISPLVNGADYPGYDCSDLSGGTSSFEAGTVLTRTVPSAVAEGGCPDPSKKTEEKLPQGCVETPLGDLWTGTFGQSKTDLLDDVLAGEGAYYSDGDWPTTVNGLTWIDGARTQGKNNELCGEGIVILNTGSSLSDQPDRINLTTADCDFQGVLYVIGKLKLVGNLDNFSGAVLTEGPGDTEVQGTGDKALFDPIVVRNVLDYLPTVSESKGLVGMIANSYRFGR